MAKATLTTGLFRSLPIDQAQDDKLHDLYRSRAELKKKFAAKELENRRLRKIALKHKGSAALLQKKLDQLEQLLGDPEWVQNLVVFYQLRRLNARCCAKLQKFAGQLVQRCEQRQSAQLLGAWNRKRRVRFEGASAALGRHRDRIQALERQIMGERDSIQSMNRLSKLLKGRQSTGTLEELEGQLAVAREREAELARALDDVRGEKPPKPPAIETGSKRLLNFMILAYAQDLLLRFSDRNFAAMVREASTAGPGDIHYGSPGDCAALLEQLAAESRRVDTLADTTDVLKTRAARIAEHADFTSPDDAVPVAGTVAAVFAFDSSANVDITDANLLGEDYWDLSAVVVR
jgi:hypothetical protein